MRILYLLLAAVFAQSAAAQTAADPRWPEARGPLSLVDRMMNSTTCLILFSSTKTRRWRFH